MQQGRDAKATKQSRARQKEHAFQQGPTKVGGKVATAILIENWQKQKKHDDENVLKQRNAECGARTRAVLLTGILKRFHRNGGRTQCHRDAEHDAIDQRKSKCRRKRARQQRSDRHLQAAADQCRAPKVTQLGEGKFNAQSEHQQHHTYLRQLADHWPAMIATRQPREPQVADQHTTQKITDQQTLADAHQNERKQHRQRQHQRQQRKQRRNLGRASRKRDPIKVHPPHCSSLRSKNKTKANASRHLGR